ncbi:MAG: hypothetical protein RRA94_16415 [Bacteroidota bacterium]|nr:hypothetical protein [Bacteroidota bacterium]
MLTLYLACLVFGGVLLTISLFAGGDADTEVDHGMDMHGDADMDHALDVHGEVDMDHSLDVQADAEVAAELQAEFGEGTLPAEMTVDTDHPAVTSVESADGDVQGPSALSAAFEFFSFRNMVYMTTFFGMTGSVLTWLSMPFGLTLGSSIGMGLFAGVVGHRFMRYLRGSESGEALHISKLIGHAGRVTLPPSKTRKGKVRIERAGQSVELLALLHEDSTQEELRVNDRVFILALQKDVVLVDRGDFLDEA